MAEVPQSEPDFVAERVWQLAVAFGQGTGTMLATGESLRVAFNNYYEAVREFGEWDAHATLIFEYARALGRAASDHASRTGQCVIDVADIEYALEVVRGNTRRPLSACPLTFYLRGRR
jgi:hypothetical protein